MNFGQNWSIFWVTPEGVYIYLICTINILIELSTSESSDTSPDTSKVENWSPELRHGITAIKLALKKKRIEELNSDENEEETTDAKNLKDSDKPGTSKDN